MEEKSVTEGKGKSLKGIIAKLKNVKHIEIIVALIAVAVMLLIYFSSFSCGSSANTTNESNNSNLNTNNSTNKIQGFYSDYCEKMQSEITNLVSGIKGAGKATVIINWESSVELIIAYTQNNSPSSSSSSPVVINNSGLSGPIVLKEIYPKALGVLVTCQGASDAKVRVSITLGISTLLNIQSDKIVVYEGNG